MTALLLSRDQFHFEQPLFEHSKYLDRILSMSLALINATTKDNKFIFVEMILIPLVTKVFEIGDTPLPTIEEIEKFIMEDLLNDWEVEIKIPRFCISSAYAQAAAGVIHLNQDWILRADLVFDHKIRIASHSLVTDYLESLIHEVVGCVKFVHEILHTFAKKVLTYEYTIRKQKLNGETVQFTETPTKMGTKPTRDDVTKQINVVGDMGYVFEEILFGTPLHLFMSFAKTSDSEKNIQRFTASSIVFESIQSEKRVDHPAMKRLRSHPIKVEEAMTYTFGKMKFADDDAMLAYVYSICSAMDDYLAGKNQTKGEDLYNTFNLDKQNLLVAYGTPTSINVSSVRFGRVGPKLADVDNVFMEEAENEKLDIKNSGRNSYYFSRKADLCDPIH